jgi:hypothetical protein
MKKTRFAFALLLASFLLSTSVYCLIENVAYQSLLVSQPFSHPGNIAQGRFVNSSLSMTWQWRDFTDKLDGITAGITISSTYPSLYVAMTNVSVVISSNGRSFSILATGLSRCHYVVMLPVGHLMLYTDAGDHIYQINLNTKKQTILLDNVGGSAGTRGLVFDSINNWIYFSGAQVMRSRPDGTQLHNITRYLNLTDENPGFQIALDSYMNPENPRVYIAFNGGLYMTYANGNQEQLIFAFPTEHDDWSGPFGVDIGSDPLNGKRYVYWTRGLRSKIAYLERSVLDNDGRLTTIESVWNDTTSGAAPWLYSLALAPWGFP